MAQYGHFIYYVDWPLTFLLGIVLLKKVLPRDCYTYVYDHCYIYIYMVYREREREVLRVCMRT